MNSKHIAKLRLVKDGVEVRKDSSKLTRELDDLMNNGDVEKAGLEWFEQKQLSFDGVSSAIFTECVRAAKLARTAGSQQVRYPPLIIRYAIYLRSKLKKSGYDFFAQTFKFPTARTLSNYDSLDFCTENGVMLETIRSLGEKLKVGVKNQAGEWNRMGTLAFDSMHVKQKVVFDAHTMQIVGFENDALDEDVLQKEFQALEVDMEDSKYDADVLRLTWGGTPFGQGENIIEQNSTHDA